jgi:hypothetical protein
MKRIMLIKCISRTAFTFCCMAVLFSCNEDIYDNVKEYAKEEIVYPAHFDTIIAYVGFERVEIDLCKAGRIPAGKMKLGKAKRTIVEFSNNGRDTTIVYDSVCSWVRIDNLKLPNIYRFKIYTDNGEEYGDRSIPVEVAITPYTETDLQAMSLPDPVVMSSTTSAQVQWKSSMSSDLGDILSWRYEYVDRDGVTVTGGDVNSTPSFFIENVSPGSSTMVNITSWIIPRVNYERILDSVEWTFPVTVNLVGTEPIIFLDKPYMNDIMPFGPFPTFKWVNVDDADSYLLKLSSNSSFPDDSSITTVIPVGNDDSYTLTADEFENLAWTSYWTVVPETPNDRIVIQNRKFYKYLHTVAEMKDNYVNLTSIRDAKEPGDNGKALRRLEGLRQLTVEGLIMPISGFGNLNTFFGVEGYFLIRFGDGGLDRTYVQLATNRGGYPPNGTTGYPTIRITPPEEGSKWHHIAITYDVDAKTAIFYQNGVKVHELRDNDLVGDYFNEGIRFVGRDVQIGKAGGYDRFFSGNMAEVRIWETIRTQEEIAANMYDIDPSTPGLLGYWKFNEGYGKTVYDYSGNGFTNDANKDIFWKEP